MKTRLLLVAGFLALVGCHASDPSLVAPPKIRAAVQEGAKDDQPVIIDPKVDILFVIDDSQSMRIYQTRLEENVREFVSAISRTNSIDFQIGVVQVWDSKRYSTGIVPPSCPGATRANYEAIGALLPLKAPAGQESLLSEQAERFITKKHGFEAVLEKSVNIGEQPLIKNRPGQPPVCESGPEVEEILTPIWASFQDDAIKNYNKGFWREDSFKVFMVLSDAKEGSELKASYVDSQIRRWLGAPAKGLQNKYRVYVAGMVPGTRVDTGPRTPGKCFADFGFKNDGTIPDHEIAKLAKLSGGKMFNICSRNYGAELAKFGDEIKRETLKNVRKKLGSTPNISETLPDNKLFQLRFRDKALVRGQLDFDRATGTEVIRDGDWAYDSQSNEVVIRGDFWEDHEKDPGDSKQNQISIIYVPASGKKTQTFDPAG